MHLSKGTFHCLPDDYEINDPSLSDIRATLHPTYSQNDIEQIDSLSTLSRDLFGVKYLPGFVGLNNHHKTDCINAVVQALAHVAPIRDYFLARNHLDGNMEKDRTPSHNKKTKEIKAEDSLRRAESSSIQGVIEESADNIGNMIKRSNKIYTNSINGLAKHDIEMLKKNRKGVEKMSREIDDLKNNVFYFIKNLDESSVGGASNFYINLLGLLQDISQSLEYISTLGHKHVHNNHKKLKYTQIKELKELDITLEDLFNNTQEIFQSRRFQQIENILRQRDELFTMVSDKIERQVARTRTEESSPKNTTLYFSLLTETKDLVKSTLKLLELYYSEHDSTIEPARVQKQN